MGYRILDQKLKLMGYSVSDQELLTYGLQCIISENLTTVMGYSVLV